jgi:dTDP-4-dehydrorhamnose 3,5-epimerase-like enzyme
MNSFDQLKPLLEDERGLFFEVLNNIEIRHVVVTTFTKNAKRGNQFRKNMDQYFFLASGKVKVITKSMETNEQKENNMIQGSMLFIPKGIAFVTIAEKDSILVECSPQEYDPNNPDINRVNIL